MTRSVWEMIASTPWWMFLLFGYLIYIGFLATKPSIVSTKKLFVMPTIATLFATAALIYIIQWHKADILILGFSIVCGFMFGWLQLYLTNIKAIKNEPALYLPGSWTLMIFIIFLLIAKFYFGEKLNLYYQIFLNSQFSALLILFYGLSIGLFIGRFLIIMRRIKYGPYTSSNVNDIAAT